MFKTLPLGGWIIGGGMLVCACAYFPMFWKIYFLFKYINTILRSI